MVVLSVRPVARRAFLAEEDRTIGSHPVAVISYRYWQRRFACDPSMVGKTIQLNNLHYTEIAEICSRLINTPLQRGDWGGRASELFQQFLDIHEARNR